jgi:hypothetical protein
MYSLTSLNSDARSVLSRSSAHYVRLENLEQHKDDEDQHDQAEASARVGSPAAAVWPGWNYADEQEDQNNQKYCHGWLLVSYIF